MGYYLLDRPVYNGPKWYTSRRSPLRVMVIHITAGLEDLDYTADHSAERTADYCATTDRKVSWHAAADSDSHFELLPATYTAFHCAGYNSQAWGLEISKRHTTWAGMDPEWVARTLTHAALVAGPIARQYGIPFIRQSRAAIDAGASGFAAHADLDPGRRSDPGTDFPWGRFFDLMRGAQPPATTKRGKRMFLYTVPAGHADSGKVFWSDGGHKRYVDDTVELAWLENAKDQAGNLLYGKARNDVPLQVHTSLKLISA